MAIIVSKGGKNAKRIDKTPPEDENYLQKYIYENPDTIPLYDIEEDIRLLVVVREFPTPSGPIDAVGIDGNGDLYLIETKLYKNPDKRTVVAQVLDYGASLWRRYQNPAEFLASVDRLLAQKAHQTLTSRLQEFFGLSDMEVNALLETTKSNLATGNLNFVVLMDRIHDQLKDLVIFLNRNSQFTLYAVEVEYYRHEEYEIVIPRLFGAETTKVGITSRGHWDESSFFEAAKRSLDKAQVEGLRHLYDSSGKIADRIDWGSGKRKGSFNVKFDSLSTKSVYTVSSDGSLSFNFQWLEDETFKKGLRDSLVREASLKVPVDYAEKFVSYEPAQWVPRVEGILSAIKGLLGSKWKSSETGSATRR